MGIVAPQGKHVIARTGAIARIRDTIEGHQSSFLIDANIFPGNSGGPVVIRPEITAIQGTKPIDKAALVGIVKSYVPYKDIAVSQQTGKPRVIFEENSGLAIVETVDNLKSTVEDCYQATVPGSRKDA
jgi:S1-C subfamily serine protease